MATKVVRNHARKRNGFIPFCAFAQKSAFKKGRKRRLHILQLLSEGGGGVGFCIYKEKKIEPEQTMQQIAVM